VPISTSTAARAVEQAFPFATVSAAVAVTETIASTESVFAKVECTFLR
jgi:hypothetical protein